jgi:RNA polymerase sigma-70 factor (ECF subfamily)
MEQEITDLYNKLHMELYKWCCLMTQNGDLSDELVQEGFLRLINNYESVQGLSFEQKRAWLYKTIRNIYIDICRKRKNETLTDEIPERESSFNRYSETELIQMINSLPETEGKIITMKYINGFTSGQIGKILGLPPGTVRSKLQVARKLLKEMI